MKRRNAWILTAAAILVWTAAATWTAAGYQQAGSGPEERGQFNPAWPNFDWTASQITPGAPVRAQHTRDLRNAVEHLLSRQLQSGSRPTVCGGSIAGYLVGGGGIHAYIANNAVPRADWTEENLQIWREQIRQEDAIREDCL